LSHQAGVMKISIWVAKLHNFDWIKPRRVDYGNGFRKENAEDTEKTLRPTRHPESRMDNLKVLP
jgi:hypothetical protein